MLLFKFCSWKNFHLKRPYSPLHCYITKLRNQYPKSNALNLLVQYTIQPSPMIMRYVTGVYEYILGMSHQERFSNLAGERNPLWPGNVQEKAEERRVRVFLLDLMPPQPNCRKMAEHVCIHLNNNVIPTKKTKYYFHLKSNLSNLLDKGRTSNPLSPTFYIAGPKPQSHFVGKRFDLGSQWI